MALHWFIIEMSFCKLLDMSFGYVDRNENIFVLFVRFISGESFIDVTYI